MPNDIPSSHQAEASIAEAAARAARVRRADIHLWAALVVWAAMYVVLGIILGTLPTVRRADPPHLAGLLLLVVAGPATIGWLVHRGRARSRRALLIFWLIVACLIAWSGPVFGIWALGLRAR